MDKTIRLEKRPNRQSRLGLRPLALAISALLLGSFSLQAVAQSFAPVEKLGALNGATGFRLDGVAASDRTGFAVSSAGDVNGDGIDDVIIGAIGASSGAGRSYVVFGKRTKLAATLALSALDGSNGFRLDGATSGDGAGRVARAGDFNGDGVDDLLIGAPGSGLIGAGSGTAYVVFGRSTFASTVALASLDGSNGFRIYGESTGGAAGRSVSAAGDLNGDGLDDIVLGAPYHRKNGVGAGSSYVVFGKSSGFAATMSLSSLDGSNGFRIDGVSANDIFGISVGAAGDINGDSLDDLVIGAAYASVGGSNSGASYVVFGKNTGFAATLAASSLNGSNGFRIEGAAASDYAGFPVRSAGDFNGDGVDDLAVGAFGADPNGNESGSGYIVFGKTTAFAPSLALSSINGSNGVRLDGVAVGDRASYGFSAAGDVNGDGLSDVIVGAYLSDANGTNAGSSYVVFGRRSAFGASVALSSLNGATGFRLDGVSAGDATGGSVSSAGDVNGDGIDDLIIGADRADPNGASSGSAFVVFGREAALFGNGFEAPSP